MKYSTKSAVSKRDVAYYCRRYQNRVHAKVVSFINREAQREQITKKEFAERIGMDQGQLSRLLAAPSNLTLDTLTLLALGLDAEPEPPEFVRFVDRSPPNYIHPLMARAIGVNDNAGAREIIEISAYRDSSKASNSTTPPVKMETAWQTGGAA